jgi:glycosyltransferase involved in cell wall biosynthesis
VRIPNENAGGTLPEQPNRIVQLEAMAAARPVVNTRIDSGVPFVSIDGVTGITVSPREPEALAAAITRLLNNAELRARYGAAATRRVREEFSLDAMATRTLTLYDEILSSGASASSDLPRRSLAL